VAGARPAMPVAVFGVSSTMAAPRSRSEGHISGRVRINPRTPCRSARFVRPARHPRRRSRFGTVPRWQQKADLVRRRPTGRSLAEGDIAQVPRGVQRMGPTLHASYRLPGRQDGWAAQRRGVVMQAQSRWTGPTSRTSRFSLTMRTYAGAAAAAAPHRENVGGADDEAPMPPLIRARSTVARWTSREEMHERAERIRRDSPPRRRDSTTALRSQRGFVRLARRCHQRSGHLPCVRQDAGGRRPPCRPER